MIYKLPCSIIVKDHSLFISWRKTSVRRRTAIQLQLLLVKHSSQLKGSCSTKSFSEILINFAYFVLLRYFIFFLMNAWGYIDIDRTFLFSINTEIGKSNFQSYICVCFRDIFWTIFIVRLIKIIWHTPVVLYVLKLFTATIFAIIN